MKKTNPYYSEYSENYRRKESINYDGRQKELDKEYTARFKSEPTKKRKKGKSDQNENETEEERRESDWFRRFLHPSRFA